MDKLDDLTVVLDILHKYKLPISPILEYSIQEKINSLSIELESTDTDYSSDNNQNDSMEVVHHSLHKNTEVLDEENSLKNCKKLLIYIRQLALTIISSFPDSRKWQILFSFLNGESMSKLAVMNNITRERVRQILQVAIADLSNFKLETCEVVTKKDNEIDSLKKALAKQMDLITELKSKIHDNEIEIKKIPSEAYSTFIADLEIPIRLKNVLISNHIETVYELSRFSKGQFLRLEHAGRRTLYDAQELLSKYNLVFK